MAGIGSCFVRGASSLTPLTSPTNVIPTQVGTHVSDACHVGAGLRRHDEGREDTGTDHRRGPSDAASADVFTVGCTECAVSMDRLLPAWQIAPSSGYPSHAALRQA